MCLSIANLSCNPVTAHSGSKPGMRNPIDKALKPIFSQALNQEPALELQVGLHQVWRHINAQSVLTQEEIQEEDR